MVVRLKIGDYFFKHGKFDQAVSWYEKIVRKDKTNNNQNRSNHLQYEQDSFRFKSTLRRQGDLYFKQRNYDQATIYYERLLKEHGFNVPGKHFEQSKYLNDFCRLKSSLYQQMEKRLSEAGCLLGFNNILDPKTLFSNPSFSHPNVSHLSNTESKIGFQKAREELGNFDNISSNFRVFFGKETDNSKFDYFISIGYFLRGFIDEAEGNFKSADSNYEKAVPSQELSEILEERRNKILPKLADEYFYRSPLNWHKAKNLFQTCLRSLSENDTDLLLKLGYIHAKFNNFGDSYNYFKKAYDLLRNADLTKTVDHFGRKGFFIYPDDISLLPKELIAQYPFLRDVTFFETKHLLNILKLEVKARSDGFIGKTGIRSPVEIIVRSAGYFVGNYGLILVNGKNVSQNKRGFNIIVINSETAQIERNECFDTSCSKEDVRKVIDFVKSIEKGKIVCVAVNDEASGQLSMDERKLFETIGAKGNLFGRKWWGYGIIGVKESRYGDAIEEMSEKPLELYVLN